MPFGIDQFRGVMIGDGSRPNLFEVMIPVIPFGLQGAAKLVFTAKATQLPGGTIGAVTQYYFGREVKFAGNRTFPDWTITVVNDEDFIVRDALMSWMAGINSHIGNLRNAAALPPAAYQQQATITHYSKIGVPTKLMAIVGLFPTDISALDLDWGSNDTIEEYTVSFAYQYTSDLTFPVATL